MAILQQQQQRKFYTPIVASICLLTLTACPFDSDQASLPEVMTPIETSYQLEVTNLTHAQPLSPVAAALHAENQLWTLGQPASNALERLAEGGDNSDFLSQEGVLYATSGSGVIMPGMTETLSISKLGADATFVSIATMLVNTNDAFSGLTGIDLSSMAVNSSQTWTLGTYDAGTEANSEASGTIPGPADGGNGYDAARDDVDFVSMHAGVVSMDDGLTSSVLTQAHRFDNPTMRVTITRTK